MTLLPPKSSQLTFDDAVRLRDTGAAQVAANTPSQWKSACDAAILKLAATGKPFTAEDVRALVGDPPNHPNAMGARFLSAAKSNLIQKVGYLNPSRASSHASVIAVWQGKLSSSQQQSLFTAPPSTARR